MGRRKINYSLDELRQMIRAIHESKPKITTPETAIEVLRQHCEGMANEVFVVALMDTKNKVIDIIKTEGSANQAVIYIRNVIKEALLKNACAMIVAHNHPSGDVAPSSHDIHLTGELKKACDVFDISLLDHVVMADSGDYFSFRGEGLVV